MNASALHKHVRLTARSSALLFAAAQATPALGGRAARASRPLYLGFMAAHAAHFTVVARYAKVTGGRALFPGGRSMKDVGGWPTVAGIYSFFAGLAVTGWATGGPAAMSKHRMRVAGRTATGLIGAMFFGTYIGQVSQSRWYALPATLVGTAVIANVAAQHGGGRTSAVRPVHRGEPQVMSVV
ncbi:MAG TPA: hypothetical protein VF086_05330 [Propionibacteriaceae bacterium]